MEEPQQAEARKERQADPLGTLNKALDLLKTKDDTTRMCGLAALKITVDNNPQISNDHATMSDCWSAISSTFLERLMKGKGQTPENANTMLNLAVSVIHAFVRILDQDRLKGEKLVKRSNTLVASLTTSSEDTSTLILQILFSIASNKAGARRLLQIDDLRPMLKLAPEQPTVLDIIKVAYLNVIGNERLDIDVVQKLDCTISSLSSCFSDTRNTDAFMDWLSQFLPSLPTQYIGTSPEWLEPLTKIIHKKVLSLHRSIGLEGASSLVNLAVQLLFIYPTKFTPLLFDPTARPDGADKPTSTSYLLIRLLLLDIRSSIPTLQATSQEPASKQAVVRLVASYDIISAFVGFLLQEQDNDAADDVNSSRDSSFSTDILLKLRVDISEVMSMTIENIHERYNESTERATARQLSKAQLQITSGGSPENMMSMKDPLPLAQLRALALWLREDDGSDLRQEASSIIDFLLSCYANEGSDYISPVLIALEGITATAEGAEAFLSAGGWNILSQSLQKLETMPEADTLQGIDIVRVLLNIIDSDSGHPTREVWMDVIDTALSIDIMDTKRVALSLALIQLSQELLQWAPRGVRRKYAKEAKQLLEMSRIITRGELTVSDDLKEGFEEVVEGLKALSIVVDRRVP